MLKEEIIKELSMSYGDLVTYLLDKYGGATGDYFRTPECNSKNKKIVRTSEGLYCHHIDEDKGGNLSDSQGAKVQPFEWQKKERLVYCNLIEHLILHIKIAILRQKQKLKTNADIEKFFSTGGIFKLTQEINDMFSMDGTTVLYKKRCYKEFDGNYCEYICLLKTILFYIQENYVGNKDVQPFLKYGTEIKFKDAKGHIIRIENGEVYLEMDNKDIKHYPDFLFQEDFTYADIMNKIKRQLSSGFYGNVESILLDISKDFDQSEKEWAQLLLIDYCGYGFLQYADIYLEKNLFGSENADEYISKAYPPNVEPSLDIKSQKHVHFWQGDFPDISHFEDYFYIVRVETSFVIKEGEIPFVQYKERDSLRKPERYSSNTSNYLQRSVILSTSDIYSPKTNSYHTKYKDWNGNICEATVKLTFTKEDFELFKQKHDIRFLKVLDGCYFTTTNKNI